MRIKVLISTTNFFLSSHLCLDFSSRPHTKRKYPLSKTRQKKKGWEAPVNSDETYGRPRPVLWPGALLRWAAAQAANPQSWTCLDATRHVDSLRREEKSWGCSLFLLHSTHTRVFGVGSACLFTVLLTPAENSLLPTLTFHQGFYMSLKNWEVLWLEQLRRTLIILLLPLTFREDKNGPLLQRKKKNPEEKRERRRKNSRSLLP